MGVCQSTDAVPSVSSPHQATTKGTLSTSDGSTPRNVHCPSAVNEEVDIIGFKRAKPEHIQKGYSSGASSFSSGESEKPSHRRESSDRLGLEEMKTALLTDGTLCTNVVTMETPFGKAIEQVYDDVHDGEILGSGFSGVVRLITHKVTGMKYAVKCLDIGLVKNQAVLDQMRDEISIMLQLDHPNIVRLEEVYESINEIYIVQELCMGGDLFDRLDKLPDYHYTEEQCAHVVKQMLSALRYLHSKNIVHRDLKLENFLFSSPDADSALRMIDFGLSKNFQYGEILHDAVGTPYTVAPEVIRGSYDEKCDMWSIGVLAYLLLSGETPFGGCDGEPLIEVRDNILAGEVKFEPSETWALVSDTGKDFVRLLLNVIPAERPHARMAQRHEWFSNKNIRLSANVLDPNVINALINFKELSNMRKLFSEVLSYTLLPEQIKGLRDEFEKIDVDGHGEISLSALKQVLVESASTRHLGALTEQEVEEIFNALRVGTKDPTIRWHEFIAAGLSQCEVDDRNLQLAFHRLDTGDKGYISFKDLVDLVGSDGTGNREALELAWKEGVSQCVFCDRHQITYDDFVAIIKGQPPRSAITELPTVDEADDLEEVGIPEIPSKPGHKKQRSRSLVERRSEKWTDYAQEAMGSSAIRGILHAGREAAEVHDVIADSTISPLVVTRSIYRAHRKMRIAILEASKGFEEDRTRRVEAQRIALGASNDPPAPPAPHRKASLVMRRGSIPDSSAGSLASASSSMTGGKASQELLDEASERGGRSGREWKNKTVSDMTGLLSGSSMLD